MGLEVLGEGPAQYTTRGKKTLMFRCKCTNCGVVKLFRKARVDAGITKSCGCMKLKEVKPKQIYHDLTIISEAPRMKDHKRSRQLFVLCKCGKSFLLPLKQWGIAKRCKECNKQKK